MTHPHAGEIRCPVCRVRGGDRCRSVHRWRKLRGDTLLRFHPERVALASALRRGEKG